MCSGIIKVSLDVIWSSCTSAPHLESGRNSISWPHWDEDKGIKDSGVLHARPNLAACAASSLQPPGPFSKLFLPCASKWRSSAGQSCAGDLLLALTTSTMCQWCHLALPNAKTFTWYHWFIEMGPFLALTGLEKHIVLQSISLLA